MIQLIEPLASGNALRVFIAPAATAVSWRVLRKTDASFTGPADPAATLIADASTDTVYTDTGALVNGTPYYYMAYYTDASGTVTAESIGSAIPGYGLVDQSVDVMSIVRERIRSGLASEIARNTIAASKTGAIDVLNAPPQWERTAWPVVTVHLNDESSSERALGEELYPDTQDGSKWEQYEGWLSRYRIGIVIWSLNPAERIALRKAIKRIIIGNLTIWDSYGIVMPDLTFSDSEHLSEFPAPVYASSGTFMCLAPSAVSEETDEITAVDIEINGALYG